MHMIIQTPTTSGLISLLPILIARRAPNKAPINCASPIKIPSPKSTSLFKAKIINAAILELKLKNFALPKAL